MTAILTALGAKAFGWLAGGVLAALGAALAYHSVKSSGAADQRAADVEKEKADDAKAIQARGAVDGMDDGAVDDGLRRFQRK